MISLYRITRPQGAKSQAPSKEVDLKKAPPALDRASSANPCVVSRLSDVFAAGKVEFSTGTNSRWPARRHRLEAGIEPHTFHAMDMVVSE